MPYRTDQLAEMIRRNERRLERIEAALNLKADREVVSQVVVELDKHEHDTDKHIDKKVK